ncbi:hypothetical protein AAEO50_12290 [Rossellomorea oryzaecorticis]|uniref:Uncharacterized protein n=1 Tax=Rossellomorea oryzaecorticis TaxID=1396505 RepID=A0ABU9KBE2_9BACI
MKIVKERVNTKEEQQQKENLFKRMMPKPKEEKYDSSVEVHVTNKEYEMVIAAVRMSNKGYHAFVREALLNFESMQELKFPQVEDEGTKKWLTYEFEKEDKEALVNEARNSRTELKDFIRAILWTVSKEAIEKQKEKADKQRRKTQVNKGQHVDFFLRGQLLERYEDKYGKPDAIKVRDLLTELLDKHLK